MIRYDIRLSASYINTHNDIEWFASDVQHVEDIIAAYPGEYKENPTMGVSIGKYLNSNASKDTVARKVMIELQGDLYPCDNPIVTYSADGTMNVNPNFTLS